MNALFHRLHNFISLLMRGEDHVCACTCGRHQVYHVIPYNETETTVDSRGNPFLSGIMTLQGMDVMGGLVLGLCIAWFLLRLDNIWLSVLNRWREYQMDDEGFCCSQQAKSTIKKLFRRSYPKNTEYSTGITVHFDQDVYHNDNDKDKNVD